MTSTKMVGAALFACLGLAGCAGTRPGTANANGPGQAPSGITAANGGGQRAVGNIPSIGVTSGGTVTSNPVPNSKGASY